jgi:DNA (cytosine-5)-methyltransferase 1
MSTRIGSLCTGYGGLDMAVRHVFGGELAWVSDVDPGACQIIRHRMPNVRNLGDLTTARWDEVEPVDIVCGGYPCQPFSNAGRRKGTEDERHIWPYIADALRVLRPRYAIFENVAGHLRLGFDTVLADLARLGFDAEWCLVRASEVGAPHQRTRLFVLATATDADGARLEGRRVSRAVAERAAPATNASASDQGRMLGCGGPSEPARGPEPRHGDRAAADATHFGHEWGGNARVRRIGSEDHSGLAADTDGSGRGRGPWVISRIRPAERIESDHRSGDWGKYALAVARWESITGRRAPWATDDRNRLSPAFVEWLMGLPAGHVTAVPDLTRTQQLKALGNGVVPQQATEALRLLAARAEVAA